MWLTSLSLKEMGFNLNKREFRDGLSLRYDWSITDILSHPSDFYNNWWNGKRVLELPQQTSRVD